MIKKIPEGFMLGASSSAWQTEGWKGKKEGQDSYLDMWYKEEPFVWHEGYGPAGATEFYERYQEDIDMMKEIGLTHYRTSINWARFFTDYENAVVDEDYAQHISDVVDALIEAGVEPMLCLEHYEVPAYLIEKYEGWGSKHVVELYAKYAELAFERYADRVKHWFTFNEPVVVQTRVYLDAIRYPHEQNTSKWMQWNFNKVIATARAVQIFHEKGYSGQIGAILNPEVTYARSSSPADQKAAQMYDLLYNRIFLDPLVKGEYPEELFSLLEKHGVAVEYTQEELLIIKENTVDYLGINLYFPKRVRSPRHEWNKETPFHPEYYYEDFALPGRRMNTSRGWEIYPQIMYDMAMRLKSEYGNISWFIAESGMGIEQEERFADGEGTIQDDYRIAYITEHLSSLLDAVREGANCSGYMLWAFTDCVSPMNAFKNRYGLVRIDLEDDRKRSLKQSAYWYRGLIQSGELEVAEHAYK